MKKHSNLSSLRTLNPYLYKYRSQLIIGGIFVILSNFFAVIPAQMFRKSLDLMAKRIDDIAKHKATSSDITSTILMYAGIVILMALLKGVFMYFMRQTIIVMSRKIEFDLKNDLYFKLQKLSLGFYRKNNTGDTLARITEDIGRVRMYLGPAIMYLINLSTLIVLVVSIMISVNPKLTFFALLPLPLLTFSIYYVNKLTYKRSSELQTKLSDITTFTQESFSGIRVIKSFGAELDTSKRFEKEAMEYMSKSMAVIRVESLWSPLIALLIGTSVLLTLYVGGTEVIGGNITLGNIAEFFIYVNALTWPVASLGWTTNLIQRAAASQKRINEILTLESEIKWESTNQIKNLEDIEISNISFRYQNTGIQAIKGVTFTIPKGAKVGIIGGTGSGKSTLAHLLLRNFDVDSGSISINKQNIKQIDLGSFRSITGYVPQDDFLFSDSIENNILFRADTSQMEAWKDQMLKVSEIADINKDIQEFTYGYKTMIGERGISLSGGQKQRVSIARALINNPKLLIFDDCFSAIDTNTESIILDNVFEYLQNKSALVISHRVSSVKRCDIIIVLEDGKIKEMGSHSHLIKQEGEYQQLYLKQLLKEELDEHAKA